MDEINLKVNLSYAGGNLDVSNDEDTTLIMFILWGIILPLIAGVGLVGNILTMVVLWRKEMHSSTILYLRALVVTDTGILLGSVIFLTPISCAHYLHGEALDYFKDSVYPILHTPGYYLVMALQQCNVWITVAVSMERYIAICHPFRAARLITRRKTMAVLLGIAVVSLVYNTPHLLASCASECQDPNQSGSAMNSNHSTIANLHQFTATSTTVSTHTASITPVSPSTSTEQPSYSYHCLQVSTTDFGRSSFYLTFRTAMYGAVIYVVPFLALVILNSFLIRELMIMQKRRSGTSITDENEANLSLVLVLIVIVFIFCQTPGLVTQFDIIPPKVFYSWLAVSNFMFATNSAVNFLIYTAFGRKFRKVLLRVFRHLYKGARKSSNSSYNRCSQYTTNNDYGMSTMGTKNPRRHSESTRMSTAVKDLNCNGTDGECKPLNDTTPKEKNGRMDVFNEE